LCCSAWRDQGRWQTISRALLMDEREADGREASPAGGVIDSQSAKTTEAGGPRGYDAGKKILGGKRRRLAKDFEAIIVSATTWLASR
jgi:hypothetical protein